MASQGDLITKAVEGALEGIKKFSPEEFAKLEADPAIKEKILQAAKATATETLTLAKEVVGQPHDIKKRLAKHLKEDRIILIQRGLNIPTFRMEIIKKDDGKYWLEYIRDGKEFLPTDELVSRFDVDWGITLQFASMLIEAVVFVMSTVGIGISPNATVIKKAVNETAAAIGSPLRRVLDEFIGAWDAAGFDTFKMATALFDLIKESYSNGITWNIIRSLCSNVALCDLEDEITLPWYSWLETSAKVAAVIITALDSSGTPLIPEIALVVSSAADFARKISNISQLSYIKKGFAQRKRGLPDTE